LTAFEQFNIQFQEAGSQLDVGKLSSFRCVVFFALDALLDKAIAMSRDVELTAESVVCIDDAVALGITRASREQNANLILRAGRNVPAFALACLVI